MSFNKDKSIFQAALIVMWALFLQSHSVAALEEKPNIDLFPTFSSFIDADLPKDRIIDGVDQSEFFFGESEKSARESVVIYIGNELFGAKWRNWKILLKEIDESSYTINNMAYPTFYNLLVDPKEEVPELNYLNDTWVDFPLFQVIEDHEASIEADAGAPGP